MILRNAGKITGSHCILATPTGVNNCNRQKKTPGQGAPAPGGLLDAKRSEDQLCAWRFSSRFL
ncbi:MAG TPA: hypothetical protein VIV60_15305, partial [Polyangiaceae bacterium]